jgi:hypothetical protein
MPLTDQLIRNEFAALVDALQGLAEQVDRLPNDPAMLVIKFEMTRRIGAVIDSVGAVLRARA